MNKIIIPALAVALAGCDQIPFTPQHQIARAQDAVRFQSSNPTTVRFEQVKRGDGRVCGFVNMEEGPEAWNDYKRSFTGPEPFVVDQKNVPWIGATGRCDFMTEFKVCHEGAEREPLETACRAEFARMQRETEDELRAAGLPVTGDAAKDGETYGRYVEEQANKAAADAEKAANEAHEAIMSSLSR